MLSSAILDHRSSIFDHPVSLATVSLTEKSNKPAVAKAKSAVMLNAAA